MNDTEEFIRELSALCSSEGVPIVLNAGTLSMEFPELNMTIGKCSNKGRFKIFADLREMALYSAFKIFQITRRRLPDAIHNRMVMDTSGYPFVRQYFKGLEGC